MICKITTVGKIKKPDCKELGVDKILVCQFRVPWRQRVSEKDKQGGTQEVYSFDFEVWGKQAELVRDYFREDDLIYVEGEPKRSVWIGDDNVKRTRDSFRVVKIGFCNTTAESQTLRDIRQAQQAPQTQPQAQQAPQTQPQAQPQAQAQAQPQAQATPSSGVNQTIPVEALPWE